MKKHFDTIIIGSGFGGLNAAIKLGKKKKNVLIIDKKNHHLFQPLLYQVATAGLSPSDIATPTREILKKYTSVTTILDEVVSFNKENKSITTKSKSIFTYSNLVIATGARHSYFGNEQWEEFAPGLKSLNDALKIRENILMSFEQSELEDDYEKKKAYTTFVIIGAGPTGVEMAGAIAEIATKTLTKNFSNINPKKSRIILIEGGPKVLSSFHPSLSKKAKADLEAFGVEVKLNSFVKNITKDGVEVGEEFISAKNIIWAAGNKANPIITALDTKMDRMNRALVDDDCSIEKHPNIFVIGDASAFKQGEGYLPGLAPVAAQQGKYVANIIIKSLSKGKREAFNYLDKGALATIGKRKAIMEVGRVKISGFIAWIAWLVVHLLFLVLFRNKVSIFSSWVYHYITEKRGVRLIK